TEWLMIGRVFCKKGCDADGDCFQECLDECTEICYKDPVLKDQQWSAYIDRSPGSDSYSELCFSACVSGCGYKFEVPSEEVVKARPNRPPKPLPAPKPASQPIEPKENWIPRLNIPVKIIAKNFMDMVASLPAMKLDSLYANAFICEAILRSLPPLAKKYALQMLCIEGPVSAKSMEEWVLPDGASKHKVAIDRLLQLRVFTETSDSEVLPREPMATNLIGRLPSSEELNAFAVEQWECFLLQLINSSQADRPSNISSSTMKVFQRGLLSQREKEAPRLTESGFQFLLMDTNAQLWYIIREYISNSEERDIDSAELISFLLELSFHATGEGRKDSWFIPTKLATNLSISLTDSSSRKQGFVVVETNFRLYAYSTSKLHCEILRLFSRVEYQLPNLIVGAITKESLYNAFDNGISADQASRTSLLYSSFFSSYIISFLQQNAHPRVAEKLPSVPENVTDQIRLWEADLNRIEATPAYYYDEFPSREVFEAACDFAREWNGLLWEDMKKMRLLVKAEIHMNMREHLRRAKQVKPEKGWYFNTERMMKFDNFGFKPSNSSGEGDDDDDDDGDDFTARMVTIVKSCLKSLLKLVNSILGFVGIAMILYGLWMMRVWQRDMEDFSFDDLLSTTPWFIYTFLGVGVTLCLITCLGHLAATSSNGCCLSCVSFPLYMMMILLLLLLETAIVTDILLNSDWEKDIPNDRTGRFNDFKDSIKSNYKILQWIGLIIVLAQVLSILLALILRCKGRNEDYDSDDESSPARLPLIKNVDQPAPYVVNGEQFGFASENINNSLNTNK
ncbi:hypothetical protein F8388_000466, partial [Cannabis sativa]